ncbi:MAG: hypothetical protein KBD16_03295 [Candidatus Pacebacteria bacterium]|nr:hypothetical protein [Candidatus Paceibacterota bacterium]
MRKITPFLLLAISTLLLHGIWEHAHIVLYTEYDALEGFLPVWVLATIGDFLYTLVVVGIVAVLKHDVRWFTQKLAVFDYIGLTVLGFLIALMVEYKGLYLGRWEYLQSMPIIPLLQVGFSPILQMILLLPLSIFITRRLITKN